MGSSKFYFGSRFTFRSWHLATRAAWIYSPFLIFPHFFSSFPVALSSLLSWLLSFLSAACGKSPILYPIFLTFTHTCTQQFFPFSIVCSPLNPSFLLHLGYLNLNLHQHRTSSMAFFSKPNHEVYHLARFASLHHNAATPENRVVRRTPPTNLLSTLIPFVGSARQKSGTFTWGDHQEESQVRAR